MTVILLDLIYDSFQMLGFLFRLFYQTQKYHLILILSLCNISLAFNSLPEGEYSHLFIIADFPSKSFSGKTCFPVKNSYLLTLPDDKAEILAVYLSKLY